MEELEVQEKKKIGIIPKLLFCLFFIIILFFVYMHFVEPKIITTHEFSVVDSSLPESFNGFKIAHFSDIHFGRTTNEKEIKIVVNKLNEMKPDIVVFTGDLFDSYITLSDENKNFLKEELSKIEATLGKFTVMGDSDYLNEEAFQDIMKEADFKILNNENIPLFYYDNSPIYLGGIPSISKGNQDYTKALTKNLDGNFYQIFLCHEPIAFSNVKTSTNLVLAGHSLGGLIRIPFLGGIINKNNVGEYQRGKYNFLDSTLFVSNGIGTENYSLRFGNIPSLNLYRLYNYE